MLISAAAMQAHEQAVIAGGVTAASLMTKAAAGIADCIRHFFPQPGTLVCYCGTGNNAGDALEAAVSLREAGWRVAVRLARDPAQFRDLPARHWNTLREHCVWCHSEEDVAGLHQTGPLLLVDGLIGLGSRGPMREELRALAAEMNRLRVASHAHVLAVDLPSGIDPDSGLPSADAVIADITATIANVKQGLVADAAMAHVGRLVVIRLPELELNAHDGNVAEVITPRLLLPLLPRRNFDWHKGTAGRVSIIAGSSRFAGAAVLCAQGAMRGGAGLVTLYCKSDLHHALAGRLPPEIMLRVVGSFTEAQEHPADAMAIGPGLGDTVDEEICDVVRRASCPLVVDADALNALSRCGMDALGEAKRPRLLTPHPGEMNRLDGDPHSPRRERAERFATAHPNMTLLLKGSRTVIATAGQRTRYNTTGHPGMAAGGMGDVLSGLLAALLCQGASTHDAASLGSWLLGRSAELALLKGDFSPESLSATDVAAHLGAAFNALRSGVPF